MTRQTYIIMTSFVKRNKIFNKTIRATNGISTYTIFAAYPIFLLYLLFSRTALLADAIIIPLNGFIIVSVFRHIINRARPYEKFDSPAVIQKDKLGQSFPSRHVFCAFIIAFDYLHFSTTCGLPISIGIILIVLSCLIAISRVLLGVHFISDVIAAFIFALIEILLFTFF